MFSHAERFPTGPAGPIRTSGSKPWGLSRMQPHGATIEIDHAAFDLDPATQTARYIDADGTIVEGKRRKSNTGTETKTRTGGGDGASPKSADQDHSQDSDQD